MNIHNLYIKNKKNFKDIWSEIIFFRLRIFLSCSQKLYILCAAIITYESIFNIFSTTCAHFPPVNTKPIINRMRITTCKWWCLRKALLHYINRNNSCIHIYFIQHLLKLQEGILCYVAIFSNDVCAMVCCDEYANATCKFCSRVPTYK